MSDWRFDPHVGQGTLYGLRLLVVGESHYLEDGYTDADYKRGETQAIVATHGVGLATSDGRSQFFRKIAETLASPEAEGGEVWRRISYYNYFQRVMRDPRDPPTDDDYAKACRPFDAVIGSLRPDAVLILSGRLWEDMRNECSRSGECQLGGIYNFTAAIGLAVPGAHTLHPSAPFRNFVPDEWRPKVQDFLRVVRERKDANVGV